MPVDYARTYANHPAKAARKLKWIEKQILLARKAGDQKTADQWDDARGQLEALLAQLKRCRVCGRALFDPRSVAAGIGPECRREDAR
jgi:hypothetical protein